MAVARGRKPESKIQSDIVKFLKVRDWGVFATHGSMFQSGFPDLYCCHKRYGTRWIEVKVAESFRFTPAQMDTFPEFAAKGVGIWILTGATEAEYNKLFGPANWHTFLDCLHSTRYRA